MPDMPSITVNKKFTYRGQPEIFSNTYHFSGTTPADATAWKALGDAIWAVERPMLPDTVLIAGYLGYAAGNEHAVYVKDYDVDPVGYPVGYAGSVGTLTSPQGGDVAFWVRWMTPDLTSRGKRIYLRKYFHGAGSGGVDNLQTTQRTAAVAYGAAMIAGSLPGGVKVAGPQGAVASNPVVSPYLTTRTLKRRGKRPS